MRVTLFWEPDFLLMSLPRFAHSPTHPKPWCDLIVFSAIGRIQRRVFCISALICATLRSSSGLNDCNRDRRADFTAIGRPWYKLSLALGGRESGRENMFSI
uniref:Uncharacterized protein n=1 Tax=Arundo donax TaxID=35708 RepID=A0A0A9CXM5_ARUDO